jgi:hypothetical protein
MYLERYEPMNPLEPAIPVAIFARIPACRLQEVYNDFDMVTFFRMPVSADIETAMSFAAPQMVSRPAINLL